jgi:hypothetical protein
MYNLYPPFGQFGITLFHALNVLLGIGGIGERLHDIFDHKPPFVVMDDLADFLLLEECDARFRIRQYVAHGPILPINRGSRISVPRFDSGNQWDDHPPFPNRISYAHDQQPIFVTKCGPLRRRIRSVHIHVQEDYVSTRKP